jgi:alpha-L-rhamnosidase
VVGPKPEKALGLKAYPNSDQKVAGVGNILWNYGPQAEYGKGLVFTNIPDAMKWHKIQADHQVEKADSIQYIRVLHRSGPEGEVYFVANLAPVPQNFSISFRITGKQPELWQAEDVSIQAAPIWQEKDGRSWVELQLQGQQAVFVVFRKSVTPGEHLIAVSSTQKNWSIVPLQNGQHALFAPTPQQVSLQYASGKIMNLDLPTASHQAIEGPWNLNLQPKLEPAFKLNFPQLLDFSQHGDPRVKYFAGTATYTKTIQIDPELLKPNKRIQLDLGQLHDIASLKINGKALGVLWHPPYALDITAALVSGDNLLEIAVTTNWANRLIGDEQEAADFEWGSDRGNLGHAMKAYPDWFVKNQERPSKGRKTFSVWYYYRKDSPLQPAGLVGPVRLVIFETKVI